MNNVAGRRLLVLLALLVMVCVGRCSRSSSEPSVEPRSTSPLDDEALTVARGYWDSHTSRCGDTYVARAEYNDRSGGDIQQYTQVKFTVRPRQLTEADRLNGIDWDGTAEGRATSKRGSHFTNFYTTVDRNKFLSPKRLSPEPGHSTPGQWSAWEPSTEPIWRLQLKKAGGQWSVSPTPWGKLMFFESWPCSELPGGNSTTTVNAVTATDRGSDLPASGTADTFRGAWFEVWVPRTFKIVPSLRSTTADGYDSAFFQSPDGKVEFYVYSPQWSGEPTDIAINAVTETQQASESKTSTANVVTWLTIAARDGSYTRTYQDTRTRDGSIRWVVGIKYSDTTSFNVYKADYIHFKNSLKQFAD